MHLARSLGADREAVLAGVAAACIEPPPAGHRILVVDDEDGAVAAAAGARGATVCAWHRRAGAGADAARPWPLPLAPAAVAAVVRLPKGRAALEMTLHAALSRVSPGGALWLYGANDEGIRSAGRPLAALCDAVRTVEARRHGRVWRARRGDAPLRERLDDWEERFEVELLGRTFDLTSFPGLFAHGRVDEGTRLLIESLPDPPARGRLLDFGCGAGVVGMALRQLAPDAELHALDRDALALEAARRNLPGARLHLGAGFGALAPEPRFDLVASNPPFHRGVTRDPAVVRELAEGTASRLAPDGVLLVVAPRTLPLPRWLGERFADVALLRESPGFRVWRAARPHRDAPPRPPRPGRTPGFRGTRRRSDATPGAVAQPASPQLRPEPPRSGATRLQLPAALATAPPFAMRHATVASNVPHPSPPHSGDIAAPIAASGVYHLASHYWLGSAMELEITIDVDDLDRAVKFYCAGLGLALVHRDPKWARVELNGQTFWLCLFKAGPHGDITRDFERHWTPVHLDFMVDNVDEAVERALAAGGHLDGEVRRNEPEPIGCRSDIANLSDPAGNGVDLLQRHW